MICQTIFKSFINSLQKFFRLIGIPIVSLSPGRSLIVCKFADRLTPR
jgi:hypothetical protein